MHIPDGFLDLKTWGGLAAVSTGTVGWAVARTNKTLGEKQVPVLGVSAVQLLQEREAVRGRLRRSVAITGWKEILEWGAFVSQPQDRALRSRR